ncbi:MAG: tRNA pseudouridine(55) synthase TruB [Candidatus Omnitrophota bacterium]|jgi:tRNA pseudouridine55 synthase
MNNGLMDGILIVDKPGDWTSHDVCAFLRKRFHLHKVGHAGTLDPMATGVLVILIGRATKFSMQLSSCDKEYAGAMELGYRTDSHDKTGVVLETAPWEGMTLERVREAALSFTGELIQVPPMVSALKHQGVRLYKLARKGIDVPREGRKITVHSLEIFRQEEARFYFSCTVSKGTYLRTLINDLGAALGCFATLAELRRVRSGDFRIENGVTIDALRQMTPTELGRKICPVRLPFSHGNPNRA